MRSKTSEKRQLKENIIIQRAMGKTYVEIEKELNCSKGTISYHLNSNGKEDNKKRRDKSRDGMGYRFLRFKNGNVPRGKTENNSIGKSSSMLGRLKRFREGERNRPSRSKRLQQTHPLDLPYNKKDMLCKFWDGYDIDTNPNAQAINQHTGLLDYREDGSPIIYPNIRCYATDRIINALTESQCDHLDGVNTNNSLSNLTLIGHGNNAIKSNYTYDELFIEVELMLETQEKYRNILI